MVRVFYPQQAQRSIRTNTNFPPQGEEGFDIGEVDMLFEGGDILMLFEGTTIRMEFE